MVWQPDYLTIQELRDYLHTTDNADDVFLSVWINTVSRNVDEFCLRQFGQTATTEDRYYTPKWSNYDSCYIVDIDDVQDTTGLVIKDEDGITLGVAEYTLMPRNAVQKGKPYEYIKLEDNTGEITLTAKFGWNSVPSAVKTGVLLQAARLDARRKSPFGIAGSPTEGSEIRLLAQLDPDFRTSLQPLRRNWWAA